MQWFKAKGWARLLKWSLLSRYQFSLILVLPGDWIISSLSNTQETAYVISLNLSLCGVMRERWGIAGVKYDDDENRQQWYLVNHTFSGGFLWWSVVKNPPASAGGVDLIAGSGRCPWEGNGNPLQYSYMGNAMDRGACCSPWGHKESDTT